VGRCAKVLLYYTRASCVPPPVGCTLGLPAFSPGITRLFTVPPHPPAPKWRAAEGPSLPPNSHTHTIPHFIDGGTGVGAGERGVGRLGAHLNMGRSRARSLGRSRAHVGGGRAGVGPASPCVARGSDPSQAGSLAERIRRLSTGPPATRASRQPTAPPCRRLSSVSPDRPQATRLDALRSKRSLKTCLAATLGREGAK
jgi:hypothetical protein